MRYCLGVDLGSEGDPTALCLLERVLIDRDVRAGMKNHRWKDQPGQSVVAELHLKAMLNVPLQTPYPVLVGKIKQIMDSAEFIGQTYLVVDRTGIGLPIMQMLQAAGMAPIGITITSGHTLGVTKTHYNVPKQDLVAALLTAMQMGRFKMPRPEVLPTVQEFKTQLAGFKMKTKASGTVTYEAALERVHDDLVIAAALATWWMDRVYGAMIMPYRKTGEHYEEDKWIPLKK